MFYAMRSVSVVYSMAADGGVYDMPPLSPPGDPDFVEERQTLGFCFDDEPMTGRGSGRTVDIVEPPAVDDVESEELEEGMIDESEPATADRRTTTRGGGRSSSSSNNHNNRQS